MNNDTVKDNIRTFRKYHNVTQAEMADKLGMSRTAYRNLESGETRLLNENLDRIAEILNIGTEELVLGYHPLRKTHSEKELTEQFYRISAEREKKHSEEMETLSKEIEVLRKENSSLRQHIETQKELIRTKDEIINMLKKASK